MAERIAHSLRLICLLLLLPLLLPGEVRAQDFAGASERLIQSLRADLQRIDNDLRNPAVTDQQLTDDRRLLEDARARALQEALRLADPISNITQQIDRLGAPPDQSEAEAPAIAEQRAALHTALGRLQAARKQLEVIAVEAEQASGRAASLQRDLFFARIFTGSRSILNPTLWYDTAVGAGQLWQRLGTLFANWWSEVAAEGSFGGLIIIPTGFGALYGVYLLLNRRLQRWDDPELFAGRPPHEIDRLWRVVRAVLLVAVFVLASEFLVLLALDVSNLVTARLHLVFAVLGGVIVKIVVLAVLVRRLCAPRDPTWRLIDIDDAAAARFPLLFTAAATVSALTSGLLTLTDRLYLPVSNTIGQSAISAAAMLVLQALMLVSLRGREERPAGEARVSYFGWMAALKPFAWLLLAVSALALLLGYVAFASYVVHQLFDTSVLVLLLLLLRHLSDAAVAASVDPATPFGRFLRRVGGFSERGIARLGLFFRTLVDLLLVIVGLPLLFLQWTVTWVDFRSLFNTAVFGFSVGNVTVSLWSVILVVLIAAGGIALTRFLIRWLDSRVLANTQLDKGVRDSISTGASYAGYILAGAFALTAAGLDFSNLAIIAGALGVGIGFGLQSIVNNFVSGLILLAERPIRAGDWISLSAGDGIVKRINVRSTTIEAFDRSTIIIPNSLLITEPVRNWTYGDAAGRFSVMVTVEYGNDPAEICRLLTEIANAHRAVLSHPPATALFIGFGELGMNFDLKAHVGDVFEAVFVASEIRIAVDKAFKEKGIRIPVVELEGRRRRHKG